MPAAQAAALEKEWWFWARDNQLAPPGDWLVWFILAGRGWGKTRTGAEWVTAAAREATSPEHYALVAKTPADARDVMIEGPESGLLAVAAPDFRPDYEPSKRRLTWPNGTWATIYSSAEYETLRGPQHHRAWCDELRAWHYPRETWDNLMLGLRLGPRPQVCVTTTGRRIPLLRELLARAGGDVVVTRGTTYENRSNLSPAFFRFIAARYEGTNLGRQELDGSILDEVEGALLKCLDFERSRVVKAPDLVSIVVAVDPAVTATPGSSETGIVVCAVGRDGHGYTLDDMTVRASPREWALQAVAAYHKYRADMIVGEVNNGGDLVEANIRTVDKDIPYAAVHASRGKEVRAGPVASLFEQQKAHHVGMLGDLEDQWASWIPGEGDSPDRLDAEVWGLTKVMRLDLKASEPPSGGQTKLSGA